ncbi:MAG TPA: DUF4157 domain-containing protein [Coleofasciculaceae cyanobacterium]
MVYQRVSKPSSGNSHIHKKDSASTAPAIPIQAKSVSVSPQEQEMPSYTPLAANWATNNNLMRSISGAQVVQRQEESGKEEMEPIQAKLTIGQVGDKYEQEADQTAQRVVNQINAPAPVQSSPGESLQREEMPEDELHMKSEVQRKSDSGGIAATSDLEESIQQAKGSEKPQSDLESCLNASKGGGSPLAPEVRAFMEPRFGADFSSVRVHAGGEAVQMNQELGAQAFTYGSDIYFGAGKSSGNNELTAHELTHVVQQTRGEKKTNSIQRKELSKNQLNVVGEAHSESNSRRTDEKEYTQLKTGSRNYWQEGDFKTQDNARVDPFSQRWDTWQQFMTRNADYIETIDQTNSPDRWNEMLEAVKWGLKFVNQLLILSDVEGEDASAIDINYMDDSRTQLEMSQYLSAAKKGLQIIEQNMNQPGCSNDYVQAVRKINQMNPVHKSLEDLRKGRSQKMHEEANKQYTKQGVWKVGDFHIEDMDRENWGQNPNYNRLTIDEFNQGFKEYQDNKSKKKCVVM